MDVEVLIPSIYSISECGGILPIASSGQIMSPAYPRNYPANLDCIWQIQVTVGHRVTVTYDDVDIEPSSRCVKDYIELLNGASPTSPSLHKYCGRNLPAHATYISSSNAMRVRFKTDSSGNGRGFRLTYNQTLPGNFIACYVIQEIIRSQDPNTNLQDVSLIIDTLY